MNIILTTSPNSTQNESIRSLVSLCTSYESLTLSYPYGDTDTLYLYAYDQDVMVSALVLCHIERHEYECVGWTLPSHRMQGYFSSLLNHGIDHLKQQGIPSVCINFILDGNCDAALAAMDSIGSLLFDCEIKMSAELSQIGILLGNDIEIIGSNGDSYDILLSGQHVGSYCIRSMESGRIAYLYGFYIDESCRGNGIGTLAFSGIIAELKKQGYIVLSLQVSEQNIPALKIYKSYGLVSGEKISYYIKTF